MRILISTLIAVAFMTVFACARIDLRLLSHGPWLCELGEIYVTPAEFEQRLMTAATHRHSGFLVFAVNSKTGERIDTVFSPDVHSRLFLSRRKRFRWLPGPDVERRAVDQSEYRSAHP